MSDAPETTVSEATGRAAIARVAEGIRDTQQRAGVPIPDGGVEFARRVVEKQVKLHEDGANRAAPRVATPDEEHPCRINNGMVGEGSRVITPEQSARMRKHMALRDGRPLEVALLDGRVELLRYFPCEPGCTLDAQDAGHFHPWGYDAVVEGSGAIRKGKLAAAVDEALVFTRRSGWTDDDPRTTAAICDAMLRVVELSSAPPEMGGLGLGDYKELRRERYVRMPRRGGLIPISQLPKHAAPLVVAKEPETT